MRFFAQTRYSHLLHEMLEFMPAFKSLLFFTAIISFLTLVPTFFMLQVFERVMTSRNVYTLIGLCLIVFFLTLIWVVLEDTRLNILRRVAFGLDDKISRRALETLIRYPNIIPPQQSALVMQDLGNIREFLGGNLMIQLLDAAFVPLVVIVAFLMHPLLGATVLVLTGISVALSLLSQRAAQEDTVRFLQASNRASEFSRTLNGNGNGEAIRVMGMLPRMVDRWRRLQVDALGWNQSAVTKTALFTRPLNLLRHLYMPLVLAIATGLYLAELITGGMIFAASLLVMRVIAPVDAIANSWRSLWNVKLSADRIDALLGKDSSVIAKVSLPRPDGPLVVSRIAVAAQNQEAPIIQDVSFAAAPGSVVGVVGASGAGKSTLARALIGAWPLLRGSIQIDHHEISHWNQDELGRFVGYVPQDIELLTGTLAENIARFEVITSENSGRLVQAVKDAGILDIIAKLPDGLNTRVGPEGRTLSGGQRQRIALARALYGDPRLVVLDEPNSNIDAGGEQHLVSAIARLKAAGAIVILITHRMNMLSYCDQVLVLNAGTVHAFGERDQILDRITAYKPQQITDGRAQASAKDTP